MKKKLENELNVVVSPNTVRRALKRRGFHAILKVKKPYLSEKHKKARLEFARRHKEWSIDDWKKVIWSDEAKINIFGSDGRQYRWKKKNFQLIDHDVQKTVKHGGGHIMVWGSMTYKGVGVLKHLEGTFTGEDYREILDETVRPICAFAEIDLNDVYYQHDNDPKHTSKATKNGLEIMI